jgi:hypothetical protein
MSHQRGRVHWINLLVSPVVAMFATSSICSPVCSSTEAVAHPARHACCLQYGTHYATYVNNTLAALKNATDSGVKLPVATSNLTGTGTAQHSYLQLLASSTVPFKKSSKRNASSPMVYNPASAMQAGPGYSLLATKAHQQYVVATLTHVLLPCL